METNRFLLRCALTLLSLASVGSIPISAQLKYAQPEWYLPVQDGCQLFVQEYGKGKETLFILHGGWGASHGYLLDAFRGLENRYHLVFYDQRGSLLSPCPAKDVSVQKHIDDLEQLRLALGQRSLNIVAHSMGTFLAMSYEQRYPGHVRALILLGSVTPISSPQNEDENLGEKQQQSLAFFLERPAIARQLRREKLDIDPAEMSPRQKSDAWHIRFAAANIYHLERWRQVKGGKAYINAEAARAPIRSMPPNWDFTKSLARRHCPTWFINGDHDFIGDDAGKLAQLSTSHIPNAHHFEVENAGHYVWIDAPRKLHHALRLALAKSADCAH